MKFLNGHETCLPKLSLTRTSVLTWMRILQIVRFSSVDFHVYYLFSGFTQ